MNQRATWEGSGDGSLVASFFLHQGQQGASNGNPGGFNVSKIEDTRSAQTAGGPEDKTLKLTIPKLDRIEDDTVPDASGGDEDALRRSAAILLKGTGFPWQKLPNVYVAGHALGYPNTESWFTFGDLNKLEKGDEVPIPQPCKEAKPRYPVKQGISCVSSAGPRALRRTRSEGRWHRPGGGGGFRS